jgi:hypothetical protein
VTLIGPRWPASETHHTNGLGFHAAPQIPSLAFDHCPALRVPDTKVGTFTQALYDEAKKKGWTVISMKNDWKRLFSFE